MGSVDLVLGDATDLKIASDSVHLIITHPPYVGIDVERYGGKPEDQINYSSDEKVVLKLILKAVKEMERVLKPGGSLWIANSPKNNFDAKLITLIMKKTKLQYVDRIVQVVPANIAIPNNIDQIESDRLTIWWHFTNDSKIYSNPYEVRKNKHPVWETAEFNNMEDPVDIEISKKYHVLDAMHKDIPKKLISMFSKKGQIVLDPFGGSALVAVTAAELGRKGISVDISDTQMEAAKVRVNLTL
jgi:DNA modification methylase